MGLTVVEDRSQDASDNNLMRTLNVVEMPLPSIYCGFDAARRRLD